MRDKFLTEAMGLEWHEQREEGYPWCTCSRPENWPADKLYSPMYLECASKNMNFSTWKDFGDLWEWAQKQGWWDFFIFSEQMEQNNFKSEYKDLMTKLVHPDRFADAVYEFLVESTWQARE